MKKAFLLKLATLSLSVLAGQAFAVNPTNEQIEQFKSLPSAEQEALAKQFGVDISLLNGFTGMQDGAVQQQQPVNTIQPRQVDPTLASQRDINGSIYQQDGELQYFGYNVFAGIPTTFSPLEEIPVPNDYLLASGDELIIQLYGKKSKTYKLKITRDGRVDFPELGPIQLSGLTFGDAQKQLTETVKQQILGVDVSVSMGVLRVSQVGVFGDAFQPGSYNVNALSTATQVLKAAGGIDTVGSLRSIQVRRGDKLIRTIDLYDFLISGDLSGDVRLQSGDAIFIPSRAGEVRVRGEVVRPAIYEAKKGETLADIIAFAGGLKADAFKQGLSLRRKTADGIKVFNLDISQAKGRDFVIQNGDEIVARTKANYYNRDIAVRGAVVHPGVQEFKTGMRVSDLFKSINSSLNANTDLNYAIIVREINEHRDVKVLQFALGEAITKPSSKENLVLHARDQILVFSNELDANYWYGEGQNKSREDWEKEQLAKNLSEFQREQQLRQMALAQQAQSKTPGAQNAPTANNQANALPTTQQPFVNPGEVDSFTQNNAIPGAQVDSVDKGSDLKLKDLEKQDEQQDIDFDSRENLLEPVIKRLIQQASLGHDVQIVEVRGAVKFPGIYPLTENATISDLIVAGGGLRESAYEFTSELSRVNAEPGRFDIKHRRLSISDVMAGNPEMDIPLISKDRLNIFSKPEWREDYSVELLGEVVFPGVYPFKRGETILDVIERAGGLTEFAYPEGTIFSREALREQEAERMKLLNRQLKQEIASLTLRRQSNTARYTTSPTEAMTIADQLDTTEPIGRMVIDMDKLLEGEESYDVLLENKDKLYIPPLRKVVSVIGEVQFSSSHLFNNSLTVEDYINKAGGAKRQADLERIYVIRANGSVMLPSDSFWFSRKNEALQPGDTIVVPIDTDYLDTLSAWASATQILYQIGVAWNAIQN
ncbi:SLBB domain-containing protein [Vibrio rotiferianus]|uniref:SLBB domain-containing protein n=1 Tax=Vibrio rotiferianus TaxID=190895 RepID=UPI00148D0A1D|nr:SLBB domain-containing protein [Vibrio rotiferianus]